MTEHARNDLLRVRDLHAGYGSASVLQGISFDVGVQPVAVVGRNGMGKTTLCNALMGLVPIRSGSINFDGDELANRKPFEIARAGIGYVPQGRRIFPSLSVEDHLGLVAGTKRNAGTWTVERVYDEFPGLAARKSSGAALLSGGEQQMLAISRALLLNARLLVLDEPSEGLAPTIVDDLVHLLGRLSSSAEIGIVLVEQRLSVAVAVAERLLVIVNGKIALDTTGTAFAADHEAQRSLLGIGTTSATRKAPTMADEASAT